MDMLIVKRLENWKNARRHAKPCPECEAPTVYLIDNSSKRKHANFFLERMGGQQICTMHPFEHLRKKVKR